MKPILSATMLLLAFFLPAWADEDAVKLKTGDGLETTEQNCAACHSLDYIPMNSVFLDEKGWTAEVSKMVEIFGAPIGEDDQAKIIKYLSANYGK
jgi:mono/diheme cytochrome c family protein